MSERNNKLNGNLAIKSAFYFGLAWIGNELMQRMVQEKTLEHTATIGHLSDLALPGVMTSLALFATANKSKVTQRLASIAVPLSLTAYEFFPFMEGSKTFDWNDIPFYFLGSAIAYWGINLNSRFKESEEKTRHF